MRTHHLRFLLIAFIFAAATTVAAQPSSAGIPQPQGCARDFVSATIWSTEREGDVVVLATRARVNNPLWITGAPEWRFRAIQAGRNYKRITRLRLSDDSTIAEVTYANESPILVDLTHKLLQLPETAVEAQSNRRMTYFNSSECDTVPELEAAGAVKSRKGDKDHQLRAFMTRSGYSDPKSVSRQIRWSYFSVYVDQNLYAPILQMFASEVIRPSAFTVWDDINPPVPGEIRNDRTKVGKPQQASLFRRYQINKPACVIYFKEPGRDAKNHGSWVVQYWFYYPFDIGGVGGHLHDSEHMFVEVDKLGGAVRRVAAAGHGLWAPNNIFHTFRPNAVPVSLPLHAIVEYGKHATAPDVDRDGWFTPGVDANNYYDAAKVWGIRDTMGLTDSNVKPFAATMMVKRDPAFALVPRQLPNLFDDVTLPGAERQCTLEPLPDNLPPQPCPGGSTNCARSQIGGHSDFRDPEQILKPAIYPPFAVRTSFLLMPTPEKGKDDYERSVRASLGFAIEMAKFGGMPGRLAAEAVIDPKTSDWQVFNGWNLRYEWLTSNLTGLYLSVGKIHDDLSPLLSDETDRRPLWLGSGLLFEMPLPIGRKLKLDRRFTVQLSGGLTYNNVYRLTWESRLGLSLSLRSPNRDFGISSRAPNPY
jgi:hypothetical protein